MHLCTIDGPHIDSNGGTKCFQMVTGLRDSVSHRMNIIAHWTYTTL